MFYDTTAKTVILQLSSLMWNDIETLSLWRSFYQVLSLLNNILLLCTLYGATAKGHLKASAGAKCAVMCTPRSSAHYTSALWTTLVTSLFLGFTEDAENNL